MGGQQASVINKMIASRNCIRQHIQTQGTSLESLVLTQIRNNLAAAGKTCRYRYNLMNWKILNQGTTHYGVRRNDYMDVGVKLKI